MVQIDFTNWSSIVAGISGIAWVNWYFLFAERSAASEAKASAGLIAETTITVDGGYQPSTIRVKAGQPVRLTFDRLDTSSCSEQIVLPDFGIHKFLPSGQRTVVEVTPPAVGTYDFSCGMSMLRGRLVAEA